MNKSKVTALLCLLFAMVLNANGPAVIHETLTIDKQALGTKQTVQMQSEEDDIIVIWVHGTNSFQWVKNIFCYKFFYTKPGMHNACTYPANVQLSKITETLAKADPVHFKLNNIYLFGWSGKLSAEEREAAGKDLMEATKKLVQEYRADHEGKNPKIYMITHSHGGNVALSMVRDWDVPPITRLIMLAAPVQALTALRCKDTTLFEEVYSIFSSKDIMQVMDPQKFSTGRGTTFSQRIFPHQENVLQAEITINGKSPAHITFILQPFVSYLPQIVEKMHSWRADGGNEEEKRHVLDVTVA